MKKKYISIIEIAKQLESLMVRGVVGIKQSFEDEGVLFDDVVKMKRMCDSSNIFLSIKIDYI